LSQDKYKLWLQRETRNTHAYCKLCKKPIDITKGGSSNLDSHQKGKGHTALENFKRSNIIGAFFYPDNEGNQKESEDSVVVEVPEDVPSGEQPSAASGSGLSDYILDDKSLDGNILWCFYVDTHSHTLTYTSSLLHTNTHTRILTESHIHTHTNIHSHSHTLTHTHTQKHTLVYTFTHTHREVLHFVINNVQILDRDDKDNDNNNNDNDSTITKKKTPRKTLT
jgi:hypothetical protein